MPAAYLVDLERPVFSVIRERRNIKQFADQPVPDELLERIIEAATWAPNHRHTEPWRFVVLPKHSRKRAEIAAMVRDWTYDNVKNPNPERRHASSAEVHRQVLEVPALVYLYSVPGRDAEVTQENYAAACCAAQNLLLAAHALGLGVGWSTGKTCKCDEVHQALGAQPDWTVVGAFSIGYPLDTETSEAARAPMSEVATWMA